MTCLEMEERLAEFLAGELSQRSAVEEHLLACADCRETFSLAKSGWEAAIEWKVAGPSGDVIAATLGAIKPLRTHRGLVRVLQAGTIAASLVIAFAIGSSDQVVPEKEAAPVATAPVSTGLASLRPSVGMLFVRDENGKPAGELAIRRLGVKVDIRDGIARTEIEEVFENRTDRRLEGTFQFPLPPDASISRLAMEIEGKLMEGEVVEREKARQTYEGIVRSMKDPALLEWMPGGIFQCRIFPIEPRSDKRIIIAYTQALSVFDGRGRYVYPLAGESMRELGIGRFDFTAMIRSGSKIVKAESTSHAAATIRLDDRTMRTTLAISDFKPGADFVLAFETEPPDEVQILAHRPEGPEPGHFAAFITPRLDVEEVRRDRRLYFLLDVSGSVARSELEAARMVVRRMIDSLEPADRFRIGCHNLIIGSMPESVAPDENGKRAAERYLADLATEGASDVATALEMALSFVSDGGELVYVGEGTPTWGEKDPAKIVARIREAIGTRRIAIRTVAVGSDAEKGLLETISREFNGGAHAISPSDDVGARADEIARTLGRSAISNLKAEFEGAVTDAAPGTLGSIHAGERLLVTGRYGAGPAKLILSGRVRDTTIRREFPLVLPEREAGHLHVKRLWAQRRLADLVSQGEAKRADAVKLSVEHQVMTPYTSFLVLENEKAYEDHRIERTKKDADQTKDPSQKSTSKAVPSTERHNVRDITSPKAALQPALKPVFDGEALANLIKATIDKSSWSEAEGRSCVFQNGLLIVRNSPDVQRKVEKFLSDLRSSNGILVSVESRFLTVEDEFLKQVGRDFLHMHNVQDLAYGLQDFPGVNIVLSEDALGTMGRLANDDINPAFSTLSGLQFATFIDPDGGGAAMAGASFTLSELNESGPGFVTRESARSEEYDLRAHTFHTLLRFDPLTRTGIDPLSNRLFNQGGLSLEYSWASSTGFTPLQQEPAGATFTVLEPESLPRMLKAAPADLRVDGYYAERGSLDDFAVDRINRPPVGGYDTGGSGLTDLGAQLEAKARRIQELEAQVALERREVSPTAHNRSMSATQDLQYERQEAERLARDLASLESQYTELARDRQRLQETIARLTATGVRTDAVVPHRALAGQVTAVAAELDLVVISIGGDAGVNEGDEFTVYRGNTFVGKITIDRVDRAWSSGRVTLKGKEEPRIGDMASNNILGTPVQTGLTVIQPQPPLAAQSADEVILSGMDLRQVRAGGLIVVTRKEKFVATVRALEIRDGRVRARVLPRLRVDDVAVGDNAVPIESEAQLWQLLPASIRHDLLSERDLAAARMKLLVIRAARGGGR